jgi:hypothetical protein
MLKFRMEISAKKELAVQTQASEWATFSSYELLRQYCDEDAIYDDV